MALISGNRRNLGGVRMQRGKRSFNRMIMGVGLSAVLCFGSIGESLAAFPVYAAGEDEEILPGEAELSEEAEDGEEKEFPEEGESGSVDAEASDEESLSADDAAAEEESASDNEAEAERGDEEAVSGNEAPGDEEEQGEAPECVGVLEEDEMDPNRKASELWITSLDGNVYSYSGYAHQPRPRVYFGDWLLTEGKDYTLSWAHNINAYVMENKAYPSEDDFEAAPRVIVNMKGSYTGSTLVFFDILPAPLTDGRTTISETTLLYTGKKQSYTPSIFFNGKALKYQQDFDFGVMDDETGKLRKLTDEELTGRPGEDVGTMVTIEGKGNFVEYAFTSLLIFDREAVDVSKLKISSIPVQPYTGKEVTSDTLTKKGKPYELSVSYGGTKLVKGVDYTITDPVISVDPGKYCFLIRGMGSPGTNGLVFLGEKAVSFTISASIKSATVSGVQASYEVKPGLERIRPDEGLVSLSLGGVEVPKHAYTISYKKDDKAGTATMTFTGKNGYTGKKTVKYKIVPTDISAVKCEIAAGYYLKKGGKAPVTLKAGTYTLEEGKDYTLSYKNNKTTSAMAKKPPVVIIKGKGFYSGKTEKVFVIEKTAFSQAAGICVAAADKVWTGKAGGYTTKVKVTDAEGSTLKAGVDYEKEIVYLKDGVVLGSSDTVNSGDVITVQVKGKGNFTDSVISAGYRILDKGYDIGKASVSVKPQDYNGGYEPVTIPLSDEFFTVKLGGKQLKLVPDPATTPGEDGFAVLEDTYRNNTKCGTASVTICGVGAYGGTKVVKFKIDPMKIKGISPTKYIPVPEKHLNILDFGAVPDDGEDDTDAFYSAIVAAALDEEKDHNLYVPEGRYNVGEIDINNSDVNIIMDGNAELFKEAGFVFVIKADNVSIRGGKILGERFRRKDIKYGHGIRINNGDNITIRDMVIRDNTGDGIYIKGLGSENVSNVLIKGCEIFDNLRNNICVIRGNYITIEKCHIYHEKDGESPMAAIDLEPDMSPSHVTADQMINHVIIRKCKLESYNHCHAHLNSQGLWAYFGLMIIAGFGQPVVKDVLVEDCEIYGDFSVGSSSNVRWPGTTVHGDIIPGDT